MIEALVIAIVFIVTEIFKYIIAKIEKKTGNTMKTEAKGHLILVFAFALSLIYSVLVVTNIISQELINTTAIIFSGAIATYEVIYKRILVQILKKINSK